MDISSAETLTNTYGQQCEASLCRIGAVPLRGLLSVSPIEGKYT